MTSEMITGLIPEWNQADRLGKALRHGGVSVTDMAEYLGVHRNTIGNYLHARIDPDTRTLRLWALRTEVNLDWLTDGEAPPGGYVPPRDPDDGSSMDTAPYPYLAVA